MIRTTCRRSGRAAVRDVAGRRPGQQPRTAHETGSAVLEDERAVGKIAGRGVVVALPSRRLVDPLPVEPGIDRVRAAVGMQLTPDGSEAVVVGAAAQGARAMTGSEGSRLVEEEQLGEPPRLQQWPAQPAAELEPAADPPLSVIAAADAAVLVVEAAPVSVDQPTPRLGDEIAERRDPVLQRHQTERTPPKGSNFTRGG